MKEEGFRQLLGAFPLLGSALHTRSVGCISITVVPGFRALGPSTAKSALNPGSALFPRLDLVHFVP